MAADARLNLPLTVPGAARLAALVAEQIPVGEVDGVWTFGPIRRDQREFGTAIITRLNGDRRRIYTARYALVIRGKERGGFEGVIEEVGSGPAGALADLLLEARKRLDDDEPPSPVDVAEWFAAAEQVAASPGATPPAPAAPPPSADAAADQG